MYYPREHHTIIRMRIWFEQEELFRDVFPKSSYVYITVQPSDPMWIIIIIIIIRNIHTASFGLARPKSAQFLLVARAALMNG